MALVGCANEINHLSSDTASVKDSLSAIRPQKVGFGRYIPKGPKRVIRFLGCALQQQYRRCLTYMPEVLTLLCGHPRTFPNRSLKKNVRLPIFIPTGPLPL